MNRKPLFYGYIVVGISAVVMMAAWGTYFGYGLFLESVENEFGWTRAVTSGAFSLSTFFSGVMGVIAGRICDRLGPRAVTIASGIILGVGFILMSMVNSMWQVYLLYGFLLAIGIGGFWSPLISTVARWFVGKRGLMTGIVGSGIGIGTLIFSPIISLFISSYGWRIAYIIMGIIVLVIIVIAAQFLRRDPGQAGLLPYGEIITENISATEIGDSSFQQVIRTRQFWILAAVYFLFGYPQLTAMVHIVPYATGLGISNITAASILAFAGIVSALGRIIIGGMSDRIRLKPSIVLTFVLLLLSFILLEFADGLWVFYLFGIFFGLAWGGLSALQSLIAAKLFGLKSLGLVLGTLAFSFCLGGAFGPIVSGYIFDVSGSYKLAFLLCAASALAALVLIFWLKPPRR